MQRVTRIHSPEKFTIDWLVLLAPGRWVCAGETLAANNNEQMDQIPSVKKRSVCAHANGANRCLVADNLSMHTSLHNPDHTSIWHVLDNADGDGTFRLCTSEDPASNRCMLYNAVKGALDLPPGAYEYPLHLRAAGAAAAHERQAATNMEWSLIGDQKLCLAPHYDRCCEIRDRKRGHVSVMFPPTHSDHMVGVVRRSRATTAWAMLE